MFHGEEFINGEDFINYARKGKEPCIDSLMLNSTLVLLFTWEWDKHGF